MKCNSTLRNLFALTIAISGSLAANSQRVFVDNGSYTNYNLAAGDSLIIRSGVYQGYIGQFDNGAKITIAAGASFQASGINNARGAVKNYGTFRMTGWWSPNGGFSLANYGTFTCPQAMYFGDATQTWTNYYGATLRFDGGAQMNGVALTNSGTLVSGGNITLNVNSTFTNNNSATISGELNLNNSTFNNSGQFSSNVLNINSSTVNNICRLAVNGNIAVNENGRVFNSGLFWSTAANGLNGKIDNTGRGTITNYDNGVIKSVNFVNNGTLSGTGKWYFTGNTENNGTVGINGGGNNVMEFYDATRTSPSRIFDIQYGTVNSSAKWANLAPPDTINTQNSCASEARNVVLPVKWDFFTASLNNNTPALAWGSEQTPGTVFYVQRSYDAANFTTITSINSVEGVKNYQYEDKQVNTSNRSVYYRIRAVETTGEISISETRSLSFTGKTATTVQAAPNPFTSQFNISYNSTVREKISVRIVSMNGAVMSNKTVNVTTGYNNIAITEAASLTKGMYLVQLISENTVIASERVVKQ
jgi:hypothetical protein